MQKKLITPISALIIAGVVLFGASQIVHAQNSTNKGPFSGLTAIIAQKFGLDQAKVQDVVSQYKKEQSKTAQQKIQNGISTRLDQFVKQGKITSAQKQAILDEYAKLKSEYSRDAFKNLTAEQKKQLVQKRL